MKISTVHITLAHNNQIVVLFEGIDLEMEARENGNVVLVDHIVIESDVLTTCGQQCTIE